MHMFEMSGLRSVRYYANRQPTCVRNCCRRRVADGVCVRGSCLPHARLRSFVAEKRPPIAVRFDASPPSEQVVDTEVMSKSGSQRVRYRLLSLPLYLVERLPDIV